MRKIKINKWKSNVPKIEDGKIIGSEERDEDLLTVLNVLLANKKPEEIPKGLDKFRLFGRLSKAFDKADKTKILELEEADYGFLRKMIESDVPSVWGMNANIAKAVEDFLEVQKEE